MVRKLGAMVVAMALMTAQSAFAADDMPVSDTQPLAPGQAAGVQTAQGGSSLNNKIVIVAGIGLGALAIYLIAGTHYHVHAQSSTAAQNRSAAGKR